MSRKEQKNLNKKRTDLMLALCELGENSGLDIEEFIFQSIAWLTEMSIRIAPTEMIGIRHIHTGVTQGIDSSQECECEKPQPKLNNHVQIKEVK